MNNEDFRRSTRDNMNEDLLRSITEGISIALASIYAANAVSAGNAANNVKREDKNMSKRIIEFGTWNGKPIEWLVLKEEGLATLVVSRYALFNHRFDNSSGIWESSDIRKLLLNDFFNNAFTVNEKRKIINSKLADTNNTKDYVFLLSKYEAENLMDAKDRSGSWWFLRTQKSSSEVWGVMGDGHIGLNDSSVRGDGGIRPAMWIKEQE